MPTAEVEAWEIASTESTGADGTVDEQRRFEVYQAEYERRIAERRANVFDILVWPTSMLGNGPPVKV